MKHAAWTMVIAASLVASMGLAAAPARAEGRAPLSVVVVLDTSGSMAEPGHDPKEISKFAVEVLAHFLDDADHLAVVPLGGATVAIELAAVGALRAALGDRLAALRYGGGTPCAERLQIASGLLLGSRPAPGTGSIVFLTDGVCDGDSGEKSLTIARELREAGLPIFGIPLGAEADLAAVRGLSAGAELEWPVERVEQARQLPALFARLSAALRQTEARELALGRGSQTLEVDPYLRSVTLLVTVDGGPVSLRGLRDPSGEAVATTPVEGIFPRGEKRKAQASGYSLLKLVAPEAGAWTLNVSAAQDPSAIVVYDYDLRAVLRVAGASALRPGESAKLAATLETPAGEPVAGGFLKDTQVGLQVRGPSDPEWRDLGSMRWDGVASFVAEVPVDGFGRYRFRARAQRGKSLDLRTYAEVVASPGLTLTGPDDGCLPADAAASWTARLEPPAGAGDPAQLDVRLWAAGPGDEDSKPVAALAWDPRQHVFAGSWLAPSVGAWRLEARLQGGPGVAAQSAALQAQRVQSTLSLEDAPLDFGTIKAGDEVGVSLDWTEAALSHAMTATVDLSGARRPTGVALDASAPELRPGVIAPVAVILRADGDSPGGTVTGQLALEVVGPCVPAPGLRFTREVRGEVLPLSLWEKLLRLWRLHRGLVIGLVAALLALIYLAMLAICASRTHSFSTGAKIARFDKPVGFPESRRIVEHTGTSRKILVPLRCRSARLYWNEVTLEFGQCRRSTWYLEAGPNGMCRLVVPAGVEVLAASPVTLDFQAVTTPCTIVGGNVYKVGTTYFKIT